MRRSALTAPKGNSFMTCRLCLINNELMQISGKDKRKYFLCENCMTINAAADHFLESKNEKARYLEHQNGIEYEGYVNFLNRAVTPSLNYIKKDMIGLDYGCGYAPTLSKILEQSGYYCQNYDPIFFDTTLVVKYDFIFSTEVFEHFFNPNAELKKLTKLLKPGGFLIIMTERWKNKTQFSDWYYTTDPTHVTFYHNKTFDFICSVYGFENVYDDNHRVIILKKI
jgi:SAM-dependent methyltransferase